MFWIPFSQIRIIFLSSIIMCSAFLFGVELQNKEIHTFLLFPSAQIIMETREGDVQFESWEKDSVRIEITKHAFGNSERKAQRILEKMEIQLECTDDQLIMKDNCSDHINPGILELLNPDSWRHGRFSGWRVDYSIIVPRSLHLNLKHDDGDVTIQNLQGEFDIDINEGDCHLENIRYRNCKVVINEGNLHIDQMDGDSSSTLELSCNEGDISAIQISGEEASLQCNEGQVKFKEICFQSIESQATEGNLLISMTLKSQGRYQFSGSEGNLDIHLLNELPIQLALYADEGRISTNLPLKIRRSDDGEQVREKSGESPGIYLKVYTKEGDIRLIQD